MGAFDNLRGDQISSGFWGEHTSTIDWCELNYVHTPYIAETINTLTNLPSILLGLYGAYTTFSNGLPGRYSLCYLGLTLIGIGSFGFHASLRWEWQLMDELPMIYVVSLAAYFVLDTQPGWEPRFGVWGPLIMLAWDVFVTVSYVYLPNPVYHQVAFGIIIISTTIRTAYLIYHFPRSSPLRGMMGRTMGWGVATFIVGFAIWNVDNIFCIQLRKIREIVGFWGFLVEGHAYWHLMTCYGSYLIFTASILLHLSIKDESNNYIYDERAFFPFVTKVTNAPISNGKANGHVNGHANGHTNGHATDLANGTLNGHANGLSNGHANGQVNGHANGSANGHANGHANGTPNGKANGYDNGHANGTPNGKINGNGITSGVTPERRLHPRRSKKLDQ
ncbi:hypothetical protein CI109_102816 [Kwoniella shandongensis]|uniref:Uncharacterized protein n=1 Tax=Kwoniella shandongensis TaxID=1734106 RepID=A0A5M6CDH1_9TREE|nr:uncharacterized protein CI109_000007 [Kwoniella shandongensis]KAA5531169.1 hypothetical protein CI109_000007 [Kwoniella shandongensis]